MTPSRNVLDRLERLSGWWLGKAEARRQLAVQSASDREADEHHRKIAEYEKLARAAGMVS
jgi:hypothetical protein